MNLHIQGHLFRFGMGIALAASAAWASEPDTAGLDFFERRIRPLLIEQCYECHSQDSAKGHKGGLLLDSREGWTRGGDTGPALVPGKPDESLLIKAVRYADENLEMPPKGKKLSPEQIADLETWVKMGAPDPRISEAEPGAPDAADRKDHWAFKPVRNPAIPAVRNTRWVRTPVDAFVLAGLEARGMTPSREADKRTLLRRVTYDLTGLPPSPADVAAFLSDRSEDAFERVVDRLLASPEYGARWGRHWLDVARYADTKGYVFEEERRYAYAYTYRDYVIRAFNEDLPFDRFLIEQLAADQLDLGEDKRPLAAMGYMTLGRRFLNNQPDIIDDRIDVVTRGMMGLTVACARCHDHKYDPIPTRDYYSLYGVFSSSEEPDDKPMLGDASFPEGYQDYLAEKKKREDEYREFRESKEQEALSELRRRTGDYLLAAAEAKRLGDSSKAEGLARERKLDPRTVERWKARLEEPEMNAHPILGPWLAFAALAEETFAESAKDLRNRLAGGANGADPVNPLVVRSLESGPPESLKDLAGRYGALFERAESEWQEWVKGAEGEGGKGAARPEALPDPDVEAFRVLLYEPGSPAMIAAERVNRLFDVPTAQKVRALKRKSEELDATHPGAPPRAMVLRDKATPQEPRVFVRGNPNNPGAVVPRQFLEILEGDNRRPFQHGSGRLELARAIASPDNPLTARVIVNRVWLQYFGAGLVRTPSDFGLRSDPPTHPELLDYLSRYLVDQGWSLKSLHRLILLSSVYRQSSDDEDRHVRADPENRLLWKMNRKRIDFESMRDSLLAVSGQLDARAGGQAVDLTTQPFSKRRTIYGLVERQNLPGMFRTFDFASPDTTSPQRFATTVPQQALFLMNSPFILEQARSLASRSEVATAASEEDRIRALYTLAFQRRPASDEVRLGARFLEQAACRPVEQPEPPVWTYGYGRYDEATSALAEYHELAHFTGKAWQGGKELPDEALGWVTLNATGGHPGTPDKAAIRRWIAPREGVVSVTGLLKHESESGDGVRGRILFKGGRALGEWTVHNGQAETSFEGVEVSPGDTLDFIAECRENENSDSFTWAPKVLLRDAASGSYATTGRSWSAKEDFSGPPEPRQPLTPIERYAQVLLVSNELFFVD